MKMVKVQTAEAIGLVLDWAVAKSGGIRLVHDTSGQVAIAAQKGCTLMVADERWSRWSPSTKPEQAWPLIDRADISTFRLEDEDIPDEKGYWQGVYRPVWGAVIGVRHSPVQSHNGYGEPCGSVYEVDADQVVTGPTALVAATRCYVASEMGHEIEVPAVLVQATVETEASSDGHAHDEGQPAIERPKA